jgi:hypothetical protein
MLAFSPIARRRFLREGRAAAAVEHPHLLTIHAVGRMMRGTVEGPDREDGSPRRIGSRSARVTGATELRKAGASYAEIQAAGGWKDATTAALYVRRHDAFTEARLVLPLDAAGD